MQYRGGKNRFAKEILDHMPHCHTFIEPFVGGGGMTRHAVNALNAGIAKSFKESNTLFN